MCLLWNLQRSNLRFVKWKHREVPGAFASYRRLEKERVLRPQHQRSCRWDFRWVHAAVETWRIQPELCGDENEPLKFEKPHSLQTDSWVYPLDAEWVVADARRESHADEGGSQLCGPSWQREGEHSRELLPRHWRFGSWSVEPASEGRAAHQPKLVFPDAGHRDEGGGEVRSHSLPKFTANKNFEDFSGWKLADGNYPVHHTLCTTDWADFVYLKIRLKREEDQKRNHCKPAVE